MLMSSSLGDSAPHGTPLSLGGPGGQADCHRSASVDIGGGRTGLFSRMRSISSITPVDSRGSNCKLSDPKWNYCTTNCIPKSLSVNKMQCIKAIKLFMAMDSGACVLIYQNTIQYRHSDTPSSFPSRLPVALAGFGAAVRVKLHRAANTVPVHA